MQEKTLSEIKDGDFFRLLGVLYRRIVSVNQFVNRPNNYVLCFDETKKKTKTIHETNAVMPAPEVVISIAVPTSKELDKV